MKIAISKLGEFIVELSDGKAFKLTELDGNHLYDGIFHPRHYLKISTLRDYESGERPDMYVNNELNHGLPSIDIWADESSVEGYNQSEY
jgi:hypothetical protein